MSRIEACLINLRITRVSHKRGQGSSMSFELEAQAQPFHHTNLLFRPYPSPQTLKTRPGTFQSRSSQGVSINSTLPQALAQLVSDMCSVFEWISSSPLYKNIKIKKDQKI